MCEIAGRRCPHVDPDQQKAPDDKASPGADPNGGGLPSGQRAYRVKLTITDSPALTFTLRVSSITRPPSSQRAWIV